LRHDSMATLSRGAPRDAGTGRRARFVSACDRTFTRALDLGVAGLLLLVFAPVLFALAYRGGPSCPPRALSPDAAAQ